MCYIVLWNNFSGIEDESEPFSFLLSLWSPMETATNIYGRQILVALRYSLFLCRSQLHKSRWRFVAPVWSEFTRMCRGPRTNTTATAQVKFGKKPALSSGTLVLHSPTCENLGAAVHFKRRSPPAPTSLLRSNYMLLHTSAPPNTLQAALSCTG